MPHSFSNPEDYKNHSNLQYEFARVMLMKAKIKSSDRILDIGSGDGRITADMAKMASRGMVIGTDISPEMMTAARKNHTSSHHKLAFMVMDAGQNVFQNQFDIVTSFCCLHWVKEQQQALHGIKAALVPGGQAVLLVPLRHQELYTAIESTVAAQKWQRYFEGFVNPHQFFTKEKYQQMLSEAQLKTQQLEQTLMTYEFDSKRAMELFLKAWLPHMNRLPELLQDEFLSDIGDAFLKIVPLSCGKVLMPLTMLQVFACRPQLSLQNTQGLFSEASPEEQARPRLSKL